MKTYKAYLFRDKDPVIDEMRTMIQKEMNGTYPAKDRDRALKHGIKEIADNGGPTYTAMRSWFFGKTRRPQSATIEAAGRALGYKRVWQRMR